MKWWDTWKGLNYRWYEIALYEFGQFFSVYPTRFGEWCMKRAIWMKIARCNREYEKAHNKYD